MSEAKRYKVSATIQIEGEVTSDELRSIFLPAELLGGRVAISPRPPAPIEPEVEEESDEDAYKRQIAERAREISEAYWERLGEPPEQLVPALGMWIPQFGEKVLREAITQTAVAGLSGQQARYEWFRDWLRKYRSAARRGGK